MVLSSASHLSLRTTWCRTRGGAKQLYGVGQRHRLTIDCHAQRRRHRNLSGVAALLFFGAEDQAGTQPVEGLLPQVCSFHFIESSCIFSLASGGQDRVAGGVVAARGLLVVGQLHIDRESVYGKAGRFTGQFLPVADLSS
jgi:hypothetical protein